MQLVIFREINNKASRLKIIAVCKEHVPSIHSPFSAYVYTALISSFISRKDKL